MSRRGTRWRPSSISRDARIRRSSKRGRSSKRIRSSPTRGTSSENSCSRAARSTRRRCTSKRPPGPRRRTRTSITSWRGRTKRSDAPSSLKRNSRSIATSKTNSGVRRRDAAKACAGAAALDRRRASCRRGRVRPGCRCRNAVGPRTAADGARSDAARRPLGRARIAGARARPRAQFRRSPQRVRAGGARGADARARDRDARCADAHVLDRLAVSLPARRRVDGGRRHARGDRIAAAGGSARARTVVDADGARPRREQSQAVRRCEACARARARSRAGKHRRPGRACGSRSGPRRARAGGRSRAPRAPTRRGASDGEPRDGHRLDETRTLRRGARGAGQGDRGEPGFAGRALSIEPRVRATRRRGERKATRAVVPAETARGGRTDEDTARRHVQRKIAVMRSVVALAGAVAAGALALAASQPVLFRDITAEAGITFQHHAAPEKKYIVESMSGGVALFDYDRDGRLDLFVSRYVKIDLDHLPEFGRDKTCEYRGIAVQCGPRGLTGESDFLFHNDGNGRFTEVSKQAGVSDPNGYFGLGVAWFDYNGDLWPDLYVANDSTANFLYRNNGDGTFKEVAFPTGVAVSEDGPEQGSMGVALGDYLNTGRLSLFVTNFSEEYNDLYRHDGDHFTDVSFGSKTAPSSLPFVGWGTAFFDYDNDGLLDIIVVNGHVYPQLEKARLGASAGYRQRKLLYHNRGDGTFDEVAAQHGPVRIHEGVGEGLALGRPGIDGGLDIVINNLDGVPEILRNELATTG